MRLGLIGLGYMGRAAAQVLLEHGWELRAYDRQRTPLAADDVPSTDSLIEAVSGADAVLVFVGTQDQARSVVDEVVAASADMDVPPIVANFSTISRDVAMELAAKCHAAGLGYVDAPLNRRPPHSIAFVGARDHEFAQLSPVLGDLCKASHHLGPAGAGTAAKLAHQVALYGTYLALQDADSLARNAGVAADRFLSALQDSSAQSYALSRLAQGFNPAETAAASIDLLAKDFGHVAELCSTTGTDSAIAALLLSVYEDAQVSGRGRDHFSQVLSPGSATGSAAGSLARSSPKSLVERFIEIWNDHRPDLLHEVASPEFVWRSIEGREVHGLEAYAQVPGSPMRIVIEKLVAEDDLVLARLWIRKENGFERRTNDLFRIEDGQIVEEWSGHA